MGIGSSDEQSFGEELVTEIPQQPANDNAPDRLALKQSGDGDEEQITID